MVQPSKRQDNVKVNLAQIMDKVKVPDNMQRQVPMIQKCRKTKRLKMIKAEAQLNRVGSSADKGS